MDVVEKVISTEVSLTRLFSLSTFNFSSSTGHSNDSFIFIHIVEVADQVTILPLSALPRAIWVRLPAFAMLPSVFPSTVVLFARWPAEDTLALLLVILEAALVDAPICPLEDS